MKYQCDMIRDLMPLCADGAASEASSQAVREHTAVCTECARRWDEVQQGLDLAGEAPAPKEKGYARAAKKYRKMWLFRLLAVFFCGFLAMWSLRQIYVDSPYYHGRKTVDAAIQEAISGGKGRRFGKYPYEIKMQYDAPDGSYSMYFINWIAPQDENYVMPVTVTKNEKGLYTARWNTNQFLVTDTIPDRLYTLPVNSDLTFCVTNLTDHAVKKVRVTMPDGEHTVDTNENGQAIFLCKFAESYADLTGEALDADGKVLYRTEPKSSFGMSMAMYSEPSCWSWEKASES